ncbi:uncharacterized protein LOC134248835 [Saccostrea cucullata]|uniref:uncharacterized protein LOC134248835 n=1 Tax=Saccostrea cuccullata TaxID=36930 RepID=UPI002ED31B53
MWQGPCEEVLGRRKNQHKEWISGDTMRKVEERKEKKAVLNTSRTRSAKTEAQEDYTATDKEVKKSIRGDKRDYIDNLAKQAEEAAGQVNLKELYMITKKLSNKFQQTDKPVKDKNRKTLTTTDEQLKKRVEHFRELLNRPAPETPPDIQPANIDRSIAISQQRRRSGEQLINLKMEKRQGLMRYQQKPSKLIQRQPLTSYTTSSTRSGKKRTSRKNSQSAHHYRTITGVEVPLYVNFIDYEKAFDSVDRETLWKILRHYGVPEKLVSLIPKTYQGMICRVAHAGQMSDSFEVKTGFRQGCLLSPFLFLLVIDWIMRTTTSGRNNGIQWTLLMQLDDLDFADNLALLSHNQSQMQDKTTRLATTSAGTGLKINLKKTELMKINTTVQASVTVGGEPIKEVESFIYLGSVVDRQGGTDRDIKSRIGKARTAFTMLKNIWASKIIPITTKLRILNSSVKSILLYGAETWRMTKATLQKIQTFYNTCLRRIFNIRWPERISNEELWKRAGQEPMDIQIKKEEVGLDWTL